MMMLGEQLRAAGIERVIEPSDPDYDGARRVWNGDIDRRPAAIARCSGVADVIAAVNAARERALPLAIRGGAHNAAGHGTCEGGLVVDLSLMKGIRVAPREKRATAQTGVLWRELDRETQVFGLATAGGVVSNTGIAGLTLGGGLGWLMGKHGLTIDNVAGLDLVTADGRHVRADADENPDLYWALRGGGGNFGVVTSIDYRLHRHGPIVLGGLIAYPVAEGREVLRLYRELCADLPDEAELCAGVMTVPGAGPVVALIVAHNGDPVAGEGQFAPLRRFGKPIADMIAPMPHLVRQSLFDAGFAPHGPMRYWKSGYTSELSDDFIDVVVEAGSTFTSPESALLFFRLHGASTRVPSDATAFPLRGEKWDFNIVAQWRDAAETSRHKAWARAHWSKLEPLAGAMAYVNHLSVDDGADRVRASFGANYDKLARIKAKYDPDNLFRLNPNVRPEP